MSYSSVNLSVRHNFQLQELFLLIQSAMRFLRPAANLRKIFFSPLLKPKRELSGKVPATDETLPTSITKILDRSAEVFFMTEIWRACWLTLEVALKPKVLKFYPPYFNDLVHTCITKIHTI